MAYNTRYSEYTAHCMPYASYLIPHIRNMMNVENRYNFVLFLSHYRVYIANDVINSCWLLFSPSPIFQLLLNFVSHWIVSLHVCCIVKHLDPGYSTFGNSFFFTIL